jgi:hypothetical protein
MLKYAKILFLDSTQGLLIFFIQLWLNPTTCTLSEISKTKPYPSERCKLRREFAHRERERHTHTIRRGNVWGKMNVCTSSTHPGCPEDGICLRYDLIGILAILLLLALPKTEESPHHCRRILGYNLAAPGSNLWMITGGCIFLSNSFCCWRVWGMLWAYPRLQSWLSQKHWTHHAIVLLWWKMWHVWL